MSSSSDSEFEGYLQEFTLVLLTVSVDVDGSDVDTDDLSSDDAADETNDAGEHQDFLRTMRPMKPTMPAGTRNLPRHSGMSTFCRSVNELVQRTLSPLPDASELAYFMLLFTIEMITSLVLETNLYAEQCQAARGVRDSAWQPTTVE